MPQLVFQKKDEHSDLCGTQILVKNVIDVAEDRMACWWKTTRPCISSAGLSHWSPRSELLLDAKIPVFFEISREFLRLSSNRCCSRRCFWAYRFRKGRSVTCWSLWNCWSLHLICASNANQTVALIGCPNALLTCEAKNAALLLQPSENAVSCCQAAHLPKVVVHFAVLFYQDWQCLHRSSSLSWRYYSHLFCLTHTLSLAFSLTIYSLSIHSLSLSPSSL